MYLPLAMTKQKIYELFAFLSGYKIKKNMNGDYGRLSDYPIRDSHDILWPEGSVCLPICSWTCFRKGWKKHFPKLFIRKKYTDVCLYCYNFRNKFKYIEYQNEKKNKNVEKYMEWYEEDSGNSSESSGLELSVCAEAEEDESESEETDDEDISNAMLKSETIIEQASLHIRMAKSQRELSNEVSNIYEVHKN
jgi:hypothetical protein